MATPPKIPTSPQITGGAYWPAVGTIPVGITVPLLGITTHVDGLAYRGVIQAISNPGVDPIDIDAYPTIKEGYWIYASGQLRQIRKLYYMIGDHSIKFDAASDFSAPLAARAFQVVPHAYKEVSIVNASGVSATVNETVFPTGMSFNPDPVAFVNAVEPISYNATGAPLTISVR